MDLNARVDVNFARADVYFSDRHFDLILLTSFFRFNTNRHQGPTNTPYKFQPNISSHVGKIDLNARVDVIIFKVDVNFQMDIVTLFRYSCFFYLDTNQHQGPTNTFYKVSGKYT